MRDTASYRPIVIVSLFLMQLFAAPALASSLVVKAFGAIEVAGRSITVMTLVLDALASLDDDKLGEVEASQIIFYRSEIEGVVKTIEEAAHLQSDERRLKVYRESIVDLNKAIELSYNLTVNYMKNDYPSTDFGLAVAIFFSGMPDDGKMIRAEMSFYTAAAFQRLSIVKRAMLLDLGELDLAKEVEKSYFKRMQRIRKASAPVMNYLLAHGGYAPFLPSKLSKAIVYYDACSNSRLRNTLYASMADVASGFSDMDDETKNLYYRLYCWAFFASLKTVDGEHSYVSGPHFNAQSFTRLQLVEFDDLSQVDESSFEMKYRSAIDELRDRVIPIEIGLIGPKATFITRLEPW